jgi:hypothetical protein
MIPAAPRRVHRFVRTVRAECFTRPTQSQPSPPRTRPAASTSSSTTPSAPRRAIKLLPPLPLPAHNRSVGSEAKVVLVRDGGGKGGSLLPGQLGRAAC